MSTLTELAYAIDPALWVRKVLGMEPERWQEQFLRSAEGASIVALSRQDHDLGMGNRALHAVHARWIERDRLSCATTKRGGGTEGT
jgi:hypothetical protein